MTTLQMALGEEVRLVGPRLSMPGAPIPRTLFLVLLHSALCNFLQCVCRRRDGAAHTRGQANASS